MPRFRVKQGARLPFNDGERAQIAEAGAIVELPVHVAQDIAVRWMLEPEDDEARAALLPPSMAIQVPEIARTGAAHERVAALSTTLAQQEAAVAETRKLLDAASRDQDAIVEKMKAAGADAAKMSEPGQRIGGVPVRIIEAGEGVEASVVHGAPTQLKPGDSGVIAAGSQLPQQPATAVTGPGVAAPPVPTVSDHKTAVAGSEADAARE
jgi:hypothetical protein